MEKLKTFRHEYKFTISYGDYLNLKNKLDKIMIIDRSSEGYLVRSLYFDSIDNIDYYEKLYNSDSSIMIGTYPEYDDKLDFTITLN